jgi:hypothetical protein
MVRYEALHSRASLVKTRKLRSPIPIGRGFLIFRGPVYGFENIGRFVLKVRLVRFQKIRKFCRGKWGWVYRPTLTSPHLTSPHLTSPHLTSPHLTSPHLTSPHLTSPHLTSPHLTCPACGILCNLGQAHRGPTTSRPLFQSREIMRSGRKASPRER